ncbi:MAG: hypothetical protein ACON4M_04315, partial [Crocinitomicaceae bacterium]
MRKLYSLLTLLVTTLFLNFNYAQVDVGAVTVISPPSENCPQNNVTVTVRIRNYAASTIDFATDNVEVHANITGPIAQNFDVTLTSGTLAPSTVMNVDVTSLADFTSVGTYTFNIFTVLVGDADATNDSSTELIEVEEPTLTLTSLVATTNQSVCEGVAIDDITFEVGGSATGADNIGDAFPTGVTGSFDVATNVYTISGTPTDDGLLNFEIETTGGNCTPQASETVTLEVSGTPISDAGVDDVVCSGSDYTLSGATSSNGTIAWTTGGDGSFDDATAQNPVYTPGAADLAGGTVTLTQTITNAPCADAVDAMVLTINN